MTEQRILKPKKLIILVLGWCLLLLSPAFAKETKITVRLSSEVIDGDIRLGDIAEIEANSWRQTKRLGDIIVASAPEFGQRRSISSDDILNSMKKNDLDFSRIDFKSPRTVTIIRNLKPLSKNELEVLVGEAVQQSDWWDQKNSQLKKVQINNDVLLPPGELDIAIDGPKKGGIGNPILVPVRLSVEGQFREKIIAYVFKDDFADVVVASKMLRRYQVIDPDDITIKRINTNQLSANVITRMKEAVGKRTKRAVYPKTVLRADLVEMPPIIKRKDIVTIMAVSGNLRVTAIGEAQERGRQGQRIGVINIDSGERIYARVIDPKTVKIEF